MALWGKKRMLPFCSKVYGVCAGQTRRSTGLKARAARASAHLPLLTPLAPRVRPPVRGSAAHTAPVGDSYFQTTHDEALAGPEQSMILIKTNSSPRNKGEEPASHFYLDACFLGPGRAELGVVVRRRPSRRGEKGWRPRVPMSGDFGQRYPRAALPLFTSRCGESLWIHCPMPGPVSARISGWMDFWPSWHLQCGGATDRRLG